jgi:hypothetical protein
LNVLGVFLLSLVPLLVHAHAPRQRPAKPAPPITLTLRLAGGQTRFHTGEIIPIELEFTSSVPNRFVLDNATYDRSGRLTIDEFHVDPIDPVSDPLLDYFAAAAGFVGGGGRGMPVLSDRPTVVKLQLNEWFRFDQRGRFRLSVRSRRVTDDAVPRSDKREPLVVTRTPSLSTSCRRIQIGSRQPSHRRCGC